MPRLLQKKILRMSEFLLHPSLKVPGNKAIPPEIRAKTAALAAKYTLEYCDRLLRQDRKAVDILCDLSHTAVLKIKRRKVLTLPLLLR